MLGLFTRATVFDFLRDRDTEPRLSITLASVVQRLCDTIHWFLVILLLIAIYPLDGKA